MHNPRALADLHTRTHGCVAGLLGHCEGFPLDVLNRELEGFGFPSIRKQLHHMIWAEEVWMCVVKGLPLVEERDEDFPTLESLQSYRERVAKTTRQYLGDASDGELNTARDMTVGEGHRRELVPANIVLRILTHVFHHQGQVAAMCRQLGRPVEGLDYPVTE